MSLAKRLGLFVLRVVTRLLFRIEVRGNPHGSAPRLLSGLRKAWPEPYRFALAIRAPFNKACKKPHPASR